MITMDDAQAVAVTANAELVLREREARDRGWWYQMRDCYHPDAEIRVSWFQGNATAFVTGTQQMKARGDPNLHRLSPPAVHLGTDRAVVTMGAAIDSRLNGVEADLVVYGRFLYRTEQRGGSWRIARMDFVYQHDTLAPALPGTWVPLDPEVLASLRPSYRMGSYYLYDTRGTLTAESALIRYHAWLRRSDRANSPWGGTGDAIPLAPVPSGVERSLGRRILVSGGYRQHELAAGAMLADLPISPAEVHVLLDGLLLFEIDGRPALEAGPGAILDPAMRTPESKQHVTVRAKTRCRLALIPRDQLDSQARLGVAAQQTWRLREYVS
jgi:hypothetical protein